MAKEGNVGLITALVARLANPHAVVRVAALRTLACIASRRRELRRALYGTEYVCKAGGMVWWCLETGVVVAVAESVEDSDESVRHAAWSALRQIAGLKSWRVLPDLTDGTNVLLVGLQRAELNGRRAVVRQPVVPSKPGRVGVEVDGKIVAITTLTISFTANQSQSRNHTQSCGHLAAFVIGNGVQL